MPYIKKYKQLKGSGVVVEGGGAGGFADRRGEHEPQYGRYKQLRVGD